MANRNKSNKNKPYYLGQTAMYVCDNFSPMCIEYGNFNHVKCVLCSETVKNPMQYSRIFEANRHVCT